MIYSVTCVPLSPVSSCLSLPVLEELVKVGTFRHGRPSIWLWRRARATVALDRDPCGELVVVGNHPLRTGFRSLDLLRSRLVALERWLPYTVTRFCSVPSSGGQHKPKAGAEAGRLRPLGLYLLCLELAGFLCCFELRVHWSAESSDSLSRSSSGRAWYPVFQWSGMMKPSGSLVCSLP